MRFRYYIRAMCQYARIACFLYLVSSCENRATKTCQSLALIGN